MTLQGVISQETHGQGMVHTLPNGQQVSLPPHDEFYAQFVTRNEGLVSKEAQERLRSASFLIAGCGSIGGAVIEPLIRLGAEQFALAEPGDYDLHNMNRQSVRLQDIGRNKAAVFQERMREINPYASIAVDTRGIVDENVEPLVRDATLIIDGVDVTTKPPLRMKYALHQRAKQYRVPVISGYDIAGLQLLLIYDYREAASTVLNNRVRADEIDQMEPMEFLQRIIPMAAISYEIISELRRQLRGEREGFPQIVYTANLFGVLALPATLNLLTGSPVRRRVIVDVPTLLRPKSTRLRLMFARLAGLYRLNNEFRRRRRDGSPAPHGLAH